MMTPRCVAAYFSAVSIRADWEQKVDRRCLSGNWGREIRLVPTPFSTKRVDELMKLCISSAAFIGKRDLSSLG